MNRKNKTVKKNKIISAKKKDNREIQGNLLYRKSDDAPIKVEEVYQNPNVPGEYAGDC